MIDIILVSIGTILIFYSIVVYGKILRVVKSSSFKRWWVVLFILVLLFGIGYAYYAYVLITDEERTAILNLERLVSMIFFFGAIFVVVTARINIHTMRELRDKTEKSQASMQALKHEQSHTEDLVGKRTKQLEELNKTMVGRELRMVELKKEIEELKGVQKKTPSRKKK